jgi:hypothetical protein
MVLQDEEQAPPLGRKELVMAEGSSKTNARVFCLFQMRIWRIQTLVGHWRHKYIVHE